ncbi:hypothetical protein [Methanothermococcus sp.]|uniref:hypothetical protein n=1 Tax=Methanothermococcus sp. TaxID=2614238 RepID=UPI0025D9933B|nr:hypothetical protein [Methanothermococcus sp.]
MKLNLLKGFAAVAMVCMIGAVFTGQIQTIKLVGSAYLVYSDCQAINEGGINGIIGTACIAGDASYGLLLGGSMAYASYLCLGVGLIGLPCAVVAGTAAAIV